MNPILALIIGAVVAYILKGFLGDKAVASIISYGIGFVVMILLIRM